MRSAKQAISHRRVALSWLSLRAQLAASVSSKPLRPRRPCPRIPAWLAAAAHCTRMSPGSTRARSVQTVTVVLCRQALARLRRQKEPMQLATTTNANVPRSCRQTPCWSRPGVPSTGNTAGRRAARARCHVRRSIIRVRGTRRLRARPTQGLFRRHTRAASSPARGTRSAARASTRRERVMPLRSRCV